MFKNEVFPIRLKHEQNSQVLVGYDNSNSKFGFKWISFAIDYNVRVDFSLKEYFGFSLHKIGFLPIFWWILCCKNG